MPMHTYRLPGQKHAPGLIQQLTQHTIALSFEWIIHCVIVLSSILNEQHSDNVVVSN